VAALSELELEGGMSAGPAALVLVVQGKAAGVEWRSRCALPVIGLNQTTHSSHRILRLAVAERETGDNTLWLEAVV